MKRAFLSGFAACYILAGAIAGNNAASVPATTTAGAIYAGVMWLPLGILPTSLAVKIVPLWAFDFKGGAA
jgi:hypothetical protein